MAPAQTSSIASKDKENQKVFTLMEMDIDQILDAQQTKDSKL